MEEGGRWESSVGLSEENAIHKEHLYMACVMFVVYTHLFHSEDKLIEEELQSFICKVDTQLLKAVLLKILQRERN